MVENQVQEVVQAGDNHVVEVTPSHERGIVAVVRGSGIALDDVGDRLALVLLSHLIGVSGLIGYGGQVLLSLSTVLVIVDDVDLIGLGHHFARQLVERRYPVQGHVIHALVRIINVITGSLLGSSLEGDLVDTNLGSVGGIVVSPPGMPVTVRTKRSTILALRGSRLIGGDVTAVNGART